MSERTADDLFATLDAWLGKLVALQRKKVLALAREIVPHLTGEDILNPHDYPQLMADPNFGFEDGQLAGLISAQIAMRSEYHRYKDEAEKS
jgi:hypothetical protein